MKGGNGGRLLGGQFSFFLSALLFTTLFLWCWEKNPLLTSLLSAQDQFIMQPSEISVDESEVSLRLSEQIMDEHSNSQIAEGRIEENMLEVSDTFVENVTVTPSTKSGDDKKIMTSHLERKACDFAKGRWTADRSRPLYSGFKCKQWLSDMWACRLTQRTDFSYEGYRWQPENCEMPDFNSSEFLRRMQDKTIAFIGDSLGRQQFQSLMCMATGGEEMPEVENVGWKYGLVKPRGAVRPDGWAYRFPNTNTTILYYWSANLCGIEPFNITDPATKSAMNLDQPPAFLRKYVDQFDVVVLNTGHHWNRGKLNANRWVMHVNGKPVVNRKLAEIGNAKTSQFIVFPDGLIIKSLYVHSLRLSFGPYHPDISPMGTGILEVSVTILFHLLKEMKSSKRNQVIQLRVQNLSYGT